MIKTIRRASALIPVLALACAGAAHAATFQITYDTTPNAAIDGPIVGTGTFSYDGAAAAGSFLLSDLTGVSFSATFTGGVTFSGPPFDPADQSLIGIDVTDVGGGVFQLIFTGQSAGTNGSLDIITATGALSHQPSDLLGGNAGMRLYFANDSTTGLSAFGDYLVTSAVPEPATLALFGMGIAGIGLARKRGKR